MLTALALPLALSLANLTSRIVGVAGVQEAGKLEVTGENPRLAI